MSELAISSLLISIQGDDFGFGGGAIVGLDGITIGGGLGAGRSAFLVEIASLCDSGSMSTISAFPTFLKVGGTRPSTSSATTSARLMLMASARPDARLRSGVRS